MSIPYSKQSFDFKQNGGSLYECCAFWDYNALALTYTERLGTSEWPQVLMLEEKCWPMLDEKFDRNQTSSNIFQHEPTLPNIVFKRRHVVANNVGCCRPNMLHPFKRAFINFCKHSTKRGPRVPRAPPLNPPLAGCKIMHFCKETTPQRKSRTDMQKLLYFQNIY